MKERREIRGVSLFHQQTFAGCGLGHDQILMQLWTVPSQFRGIWINDAALESAKHLFNRFVGQKRLRGRVLLRSISEGWMTWSSVTRLNRCGASPEA
jgi:hypothetical protein